MEDCNDKKRRLRDESQDSPESMTHRLDSPESKIRRVDSSDSGDNSSESKLIRVDSGPDSVIDSDVQLQDDIFNILDDADNVAERDSVQGLDSVIKSFEDEINAPSSGDPTQMPDNLGYLFEASDDELGLPPKVVSGEEAEPGRVDPKVLELTGLMGFDDDIPSYDAFGFGFAAELDGGSGGLVTVDGLFDYAELAADVLWRSESLQAM
ncbi:hypothetical protein CR513_42766, partial [Mucuna pruriens]